MFNPCEQINTKWYSGSTNKVANFDIIEMFE